MADDLELEGGYQYTFYVTLQETPAQITAEIKPWNDGRTTDYDALQISDEMGSNEGALEGDIIKVYMQDADAFSLLSDYTYNGTAWEPETPVYWEDISADPAVLRASLEREEALHETQMPDILVSETINVARNRSAHFVLQRAATKVFVVLESSTFDQDELDDADIVLPDYLTGGSVVDGAYVEDPAGQRGNIIVDRTNPALGVALFNPQRISPEGAVVTVTIAGRDYTAYAGSQGMNFQAGIANTLVVKLEQQEATVSARIVDWKEGTPSEMEVVEFGTPAGASENVDFGTQMTVFMEDEGGNALPPYNFTYNPDGKWRTTPTIYWNDIQGDGPYTVRSWILPEEEAWDPSQIEDYLVADEITVDKFNGADLTLRHAASMVLVSLSSSTFSAVQLASATVSFPDYETGGSFSNGEFIPGSTPGDITPVKDISGAWKALIQPQTIPAGNTILSVTIADKTYNAVATGTDFTYAPGEITRITVYVEENALTVSATVVDWTSRDINLNALLPTVIQEDSEGVLDGEQMAIYYYVSGNPDIQTATYTYDASTGQWSSPAPIFWDDLRVNSPITATLFRQPAAYNDTQVADHMILSSSMTVPPTSANMHFNFVHPASKIFIQVDGGTDFTDEEIEAMTFTLPQYISGGKVINGQYVYGNTTGDIEVAVDEDGQAVAIIDPQTIQAGNTVVRIRNQAGQVYNATYGSNLTFSPRQSTVLKIQLRKTGLSLSASTVDWIPQTPIELIPTAIVVSGQLGDTDDFFRNKTIHLYKWGGANAANFWTDTYSYLQGQNGFVWSGTPRYWDDQVSPLNMTAVHFPVEESIPTVANNTISFPWSVPANQSSGYDNYDILTDYLPVSAPQALNFEFEHPLSKMTLVLVSDEFTVTEMERASITLNDFMVGGEINMPQGTATATGTGQTVIPFTETAGVQYSALLMPQPKAANTNIITVTLPQYSNTPFQGSLSTALNLTAGNNHIITIRLRRTSIQMSATVKPWVDSQTGEIVIE